MHTCTELDRVRVGREHWGAYDWLVWAYRDQQVHRTYDGAVGRIGPAPVRSGLARAMRVGALGCQIDCDGAAGRGADHTPDLAVAIHEAVLALPIEVRAVVMALARSGEQPQHPDQVQPRLVPVRKKDGQICVETRVFGRHRVPVLCLVQWNPTPEHAAYVAELWELWQRGLAAVDATLSAWFCETIDA